MKASQILTLFTVFLVGVNGIAKDNDDSVIPWIRVKKQMLEKSLLRKKP